MCAFNTGAGVIPPADNRIDGREADSEETLKRKEAARVYEDIRLHELAPNDEMYDAMENFLLGDPKGQIETLGSEAVVIERGDSAKSGGHGLIARAEYETAAKIAIYNQNKEAAVKALNLAMEVTDSTTQHWNFQKTILAEIDEFLRIARDYYSTVPAEAP
jgi:hypothetical protein